MPISRSASTERDYVAAEQTPGRACACGCGKSINHMAGHALYAPGCYDAVHARRKAELQIVRRKSRKDGTYVAPEIKKCETCPTMLTGRVQGARFCKVCIVERRFKARWALDQGINRKSQNIRQHLVRNKVDGSGLEARQPEPKCKVCAGMSWAIAVDREQDPMSGPQTKPRPVGFEMCGRVLCRGCGAVGDGRDAPLPDRNLYGQSSMAMASDTGRLYGYAPATNAKGTGLENRNRVRPGGRAGRVRGNDNADDTADSG
jgi:hypothetical protein